MPDVALDRDQMAHWYANRHLKTDPGIQTIYYLPRQAADREIRLLEINELMAEREGDPFEPIDFGVDVGTKNACSLVVLDVTPAQWEKIRADQIPLPSGWTLDGATVFSR